MSNQGLTGNEQMRIAALTAAVQLTNREPNRSQMALADDVINLADRFLAYIADEIE